VPLDEADWDLWCAAIAVNLVGAVYCCRRAVRHFKSRPADGPHAKIINISGGGATSPQPCLSAYGASKAGLVRFTETLAMEVKPFGIDVNAVAPGALLTRLLEELRSVSPEQIGAAQHAKVEEIYGQGGMSLARAAELCVYLASFESDGISGRLISAPWDPWPFSAEIAGELAASDIYTLRRIVPEDRGHSWPESS
jgi:3-oxoacyl-[acyl-carrier protein] reductase